MPNNLTYTPKQMRLKAVPEDIYKILLEEQGKIKQGCNCQVSLESTIYKIIRKVGKEESDGTKEIIFKNGPLHNLTHRVRKVTTIYKDSSASPFNSTERISKDLPFTYEENPEKRGEFIFVGYDAVKK